MKTLVSTLLLTFALLHAYSQSYVVDTSFRISEYISGNRPIKNSESPRIRHLLTLNDTMFVATGDFGVFDESNGNWIGESMVWFDETGKVREPCLFTHDTTFRYRASAFSQGYYYAVRASHPFVQRISIQDCIYDTAFAYSYINWFQSPINFTTYQQGLFFPSGSSFYGGLFDKQIADTTIRSSMYKLKKNGQWDTNFYMPVSNNNAPIGLTKYSEDKMLVYSGMTELDGHYSNGIFLLDTLGNVDTSFSCDIYRSGIGYIKVMSDDKIFAFGEFLFDTAWTDDSYLVRLNADGSFDSTFNRKIYTTQNYFPQHPNLLQTPRDVIETKWGTYLFVGSIDSIDGRKIPYMFETDKQGNILPTQFNFTLGDTVGFDTIEDCYIFADCYMELNRIIYADSDSNSFIVAGAFHTLNGKNHPPIFKISRFGLSIEEQGLKPKPIGLFPNPAKGEFNIEFDRAYQLERVQVHLINLLGITLKEWHFDLNSGLNHTLRLDNYPTGQYLVQIRTADGFITKRLIIAE